MEVGCGVGITACYIAKRIGPQVMSVDISERMVDRANERAKRLGIEDRVEFRVDNNLICSIIGNLSQNKF